MNLLDFQHYPGWLNLVLFAGAAGVVWIAGATLTTYADVIATRTGLGQAFMGLLFLAGATSLPELSSVATAGLIGNGALAVSDLLGTLVVNAAVLAIADLVFGEGALTSFAPRAVLLLQGAASLPWEASRWRTWPRATGRSWGRLASGPPSLSWGTSRSYDSSSSTRRGAAGRRCMCWKQRKRRRLRRSVAAALRIGPREP